MIPINQSDRETVLLKKNNIIDWKIKMADLSQMDFNELEQYIDNNVTDMAAAKLYIKKQSKALLALMKLFEEKIK
jgi:hypothetical protein